MIAKSASLRAEEPISKGPRINKLDPNTGRAQSPEFGRTAAEQNPGARILQHVEDENSALTRVNFAG